MTKLQPTPEDWRDAYLMAVGAAGTLDEVATILVAEIVAKRQRKEEAETKPKPLSTKDHPHGKA
jgi:hypothetical protein